MWQWIIAILGASMGVWNFLTLVFVLFLLLAAFSGSIEAWLIIGAIVLIFIMALIGSHIKNKYKDFLHERYKNVWDQLPEEEKKICTWLSSHGVRFQYEQPYPYITADTQHRQYKPDFTIFYTQNGQEKRIFLEHFGIDSQGNVPQWFGEGSGGFYAANQKYKADIVWKRERGRATPQ